MYQPKTYYVYIMASKPFGTLYIGITGDIERRVYQHKYEPQGFVEKYKVNKLVYFEKFYNPNDAIKFEKQLKYWKRQWKIRLIMKFNPTWVDFFEVWHPNILPPK